MGTSRRKPRLSGVLKEDVRQAMEWLCAVSNASVVCGLAMEATESGYAVTTVVARLERAQPDGTRKVLLRYVAPFPNAEGMSLEAVCLHALYQLERMWEMPPTALERTV